MFIHVGVEDWAFAAMLGEARRRSNEKVRNPKRDRGFEVNVRNDLVGSMGELLALRFFDDQISDTQRRSQEHHLFGMGGGAGFSCADLLLDKRQDAVRLDIKTFDCSPHKRFFAVNAKKHRQLAGACDGYACLFIPVYSSLAAVGDILPYEAVNQWNCANLGRHRDPAFLQPIGRMIADRFSKNVLKSLNGARVFEREEIRSALRSASLRAEFFRRSPSAERLFCRTN